MYFYLLLFWCGGGFGGGGGTGGGGGDDDNNNVINSQLSFTEGIIHSGNSLEDKGRTENTERRIV